jgi:predicted lipoprotein with Yx(FWY)xxD motif
MKFLSALIAAALLAAGSPAFAAKSCDELKTEIAAKLDAKSVSGYTLEIVEADKAGEAKVVGSCEGGAKKITYAKK